jgi:energy-coupling factor transport system substrate-specific component
VAFVAGVALAQGAAPANAGAPGPTRYLLRAQHPDGGFGSAPTESSSELYTGWTALGLAGLGHNPLDVRRAGARSELDYVRAGVGSLSDTGALERTILVVRAAGVSARSFGGRDLVAALERQIRSDGSVAEKVNWSSFAVLALRAAGLTPAAQTLSWIARQQNHDGGFSFATSGAGGSDVDDTGAALEALAGAPGAGVVRARAVAYLRGQQNPDGGFPADSGGESNAQSTAWGIQGLLAAGVEPNSLHRGGAVSPLSFLSSLIDADGHVRYSRTSDQTPVWVTAQAALALARKPLPIAPVPRPRRVRRAVLSAPRSASAATEQPRAPVRTRPSRPRSHTPTPAATELAGEAGTLLALVFAPLDPR